MPPSAPHTLICEAPEPPPRLQQLVDETLVALLLIGCGTQLLEYREPRADTKEAHSAAH